MYNYFYTTCLNTFSLYCNLNVSVKTNIYGTVQSYVIYNVFLNYFFILNYHNSNDSIYHYVLHPAEIVNSDSVRLDKIYIHTHSLKV